MPGRKRQWPGRRAVEFSAFSYERAVKPMMANGITTAGSRSSTVLPQGLTPREEPLVPEHTPAGSRSRRIRLVLLLLGTGLALYGLLGLCLDLHLPERLVQGLALWRGLLEAGQLPPVDAPYPWNVPGWFQVLAAHYDRTVLLVWLAWGAGVFLLWLAAGHRPKRAVPPRQRLAWRDGLALLLLAGIMILAYALRARFLLPLPNGVFPVSHYDEMVYLEAAVLWRGGLFPYADFFLAHPPGILYALWPAALAGGAWGGPAVVAAGRAWQCALGLAAVALLYLVGRQLAGRRAGLLAALILALDVQAVQVAPLETVANLFTVGALALYLGAQRCSRRWARFALLGLAGGTAAFAALTKAPAGVALLLLALLALLAWQWWDIVAGVLGAAATALLVAGPLALRAPGAFWRQVLAFQLLRPQETTYARNHLARMADYPEARLTFLLLIAAVLALTAVALAGAWGTPAVRRGRRAAAWSLGWVLPLAATIALLLALFSYGRAYHSRYYIQLVVPFALLVALALGAALRWAGDWPRWARALGAACVVVYLALCWPHLGQQRLTAEAVRYDGTYGPIGQVLRENTPAQGAVLALDPGYPLLAGRPPALLPDGSRIVDGAGTLVYRVLGVAAMGPGQVWRGAQEASREIEPKAFFHQPAAQDAVVSALHSAAASVIDPRIAAEDLTPQTQEFLATRGREIARVQFTAAFTVDRAAFRGRNRAGLDLWDLNVRPLTPQGEGPAARPDEPLEISLDQVLQVSLYWHVTQVPTAPLKVALELRDGEGRAVARLWEPPHFGDPPVGRWLPGWVYQDHHNLPLPPDLRPAEYTLYVGLLEATSSRPWPWEEATQVDGALPVGLVRVGP